MKASAFLYRTKLLQNRDEHNRFARILREERVSSYLEIGSMYGGSLWAIAMRGMNARRSKLVSVDWAVDTPEARVELDACIAELQRLDFDAHLIDGNSADPEVVERARGLGPYDCVFIDGAHTLEAVSSDWENYGPMGRLVAFHDIAWNDTWRSSVPGRAFKRMGVPDLWNRIKADYRHEEICYQVPRNYYGIGVLWR